MTINCKGNLVDLTAPKVMGILNLTPDSFYDGGKHKNLDDALRQTEKMVTDGATFIDIGAYSSRPDAKHITEEEELSRLLPILQKVVKVFPEILISVDTFRSKIAQIAIENEAALINDISGGQLDQKMLETVAQLQVPYIAMHMRGTPQNMKQLTSYDNLVKDVIRYFSNLKTQATALKLNDLIIDPGFGFAKTQNQNFELLSKMHLLQHLELPILAGISRKSMIYKTLGITAQEALNGSTALHMVCLQQGAKLLRVHDVKEAKETITLWQNLYPNNF
ncbi:dihydropteroate synthase [Croceivirga radicis]|uniref:Dihydropteroate synthase n=1 Tax=Croceivirga radicis TaxID=1929488 RepID=A0A1V6LQ54_9FLAO|nr:dihydropteroate synthase [Croceivirga radicis]OQD42096.1 dihydropteroate synthase [Croceivirga radicis]